MKKILVILLTACYIVAVSCHQNKKNFPVLTGLYLGQTPPGNNPEINAPGDNANSAFVSLDGKYLFFSSSRRDPVLPKITSGTSLRDLINTKSAPGYGSSAIYWVDAKIIKDLKPKW